MMDFINKLNGNEYECGITSIVFANSKTFDSFQLGFRTDGQEKDNLISDDVGAWKKTWYVIAKDTMMGDPYFIDTSDNKIYYVGYDCNYDTDVSLIVDSLDSFIKIWEIIDKNLKNIYEDNTDLDTRIKLSADTLKKIEEIDSSVYIEYFEDIFNIWLDIVEL